MRVLRAILPANPEQTCISLLKSITHTHHFNQILGFFFTNGFRHSSFVTTKLLDFCNSTYRMEVAYSIFNQIPYPDSFVYTSLMRGFSQHGPHHRCMFYFSEMHEKGIEPNYLTYPFVLKACSNLKALLEGEQVYTHVVKSGYGSDIYVSNCVIDLYSKCGCVTEAHNLYDEMPRRDVVSHTSMIYGYLSVGDLVSAELVFSQVEEKDIVLWTAMIAGYAQNGAPAEALELFDKMQDLGVRPNLVTMVSLVSACSQLGDNETGRWAHDFMVKSGMPINIISCTALMDMYFKWGLVDEALDLFNKFQGRDVVVWNSLISGYAKNGYAKEALEVFKEMHDMGLEPNEVTFLSVLSSCAQLGALVRGKEIAHTLTKMGFGSDLSIGTALLDMYTKCGSIIDANQVFNIIYSKDVVTWSAMIIGYASDGHFKEAISLFGGLLKDGVRPNHVTFLGLLMACSHGGLVSEGYELFASMTRDYGIPPRMEHYGCIVDLLGRAGELEVAKSFIESMPIEPGVSVWASLLGACTTHKNTEIGEFAARQLIELEPANDENYVSLSNIYAAKGRWDDVESTRTTMKHQGAHKTPGCSWIEVEGRIHEFLVGDGTDRAHPQSFPVYDILNNLSAQLKLAGEHSFNEHGVANLISLS